MKGLTLALLVFSVLLMETSALSQDAPPAVKDALVEKEEKEIPKATSIPAIMANIEPESATVGDVLTYSISITWPKEIKVIPPDKDENLGKCRVLEREVGDLVTKDDIHKLDMALKIACYETGEQEMPSLKIYFDDANGQRRSLDGPKLRVNILRTLPEDAKELKPIKPIKDMPPDYLKLVLILVGMLLVLALVYFLYTRLRNRQRAAEEEDIKAPDPYDLAMKRFESGDLETLLKKENIDGFYVELTDILREYIEGRFGVQALEMTTREIRWELKSAPIDDFLKAELHRILERADFAKFARSYPKNHLCKEDMALGKKFINKTKPEPEPDKEKSNNQKSEPGKRPPEISFDTDGNSKGEK